VTWRGAAFPVDTAPGGLVQPTVRPYRGGFLAVAWRDGVNGGFLPALWWSPDGRAWAAVGAPPPEQFTGTKSFAVLGDSVFLFGQSPRAGNESFGWIGRPESAR
jgi:hypothetical protein